MERDGALPISEQDMEAIRKDATEFAGIGLYRYKFDGTIVFMDRATLTILELDDRFSDTSELRGRNVSELIVYLGEQGMLRHEIRERGHVRNWEFEFRTLSGNKKCILHDSYLVVDPVTGEEEVQAIIRDITVRKRALDALIMDESRFEALLKLSQMTHSSTDEITAFAMEEAVRLTRSRVGYVAFVNEDQSVLTMHAWSSEAMEDCRAAAKPLVYALKDTGMWGEAVRQRKPIITNDYAAPSPLKRGYPEGHIELTRHMNIPVFDRERIVMVAGVGNKEEPYDESDVRQLNLLMSGVWKVIKQNEADEEIRTINRTLKVLSAVNQTLVRADDEISLMNDALQVIIDIGGYRMAWIAAAERDAEKTMVPVCSAGDTDGYLENLRISWGNNEAGTGPTGAAIRTGEPQIVDDISEDPRSAPWREAALSRGYRSSIALPLALDQRTVLGTINIYADCVNAFDDAEILLLGELAADLAYGIATIRTRQQHDAAERELQLQREDYLTIYDTVPAVILYLDQDSRVVRANQAAVDTLGISQEEMVGRTLRAILPADAGRLIADNIEVLATGMPKSGLVEEITMPSGDVRWFRTDKLPSSDHGGEPNGVIIFALDISERVAADQRRQELEEHQREFYRRTILAATQGKLVICERSEIDSAAGPAMEKWILSDSSQLAGVRQAIKKVCSSFGMDESRAYDLLLCVGEAGTNAIKHGGGGRVAIRRTEDGVLVEVTDDGPGIETLLLPESTLRLGYSTAGSLGMGYKAIISITDKVYLATGPQGTTVAFELKLQQQREEALTDISSLPDTWM